MQVIGMIILGNTVVIRDKTYDYIFMHLHSVDVEINQEVVEGHHLHFAITKGSYTTKNYVNPLDIIAIQS